MKKSGGARSLEGALSNQLEALVSATKGLETFEKAISSLGDAAKSVQGSLSSLDSVQRAKSAAESLVSNLAPAAAEAALPQAIGDLIRKIDDALAKITGISAAEQRIEGIGAELGRAGIHDPDLLKALTPMVVQEEEGADLGRKEAQRAFVAAVPRGPSLGDAYQDSDFYKAKSELADQIVSMWDHFRKMLKVNGITTATGQ